MAYQTEGIALMLGFQSLRDELPFDFYEELRAAIKLANAKWPGVSVVASRRSSERTGTLNSAALQDAALKRLGFRAVADRPAQLAALLRQVEEGPGTGELKLPPEFKSPPDSRAFSLPASVRGEHLRGALALLSSLHLASNQKEAGQASLAGIARLVAASRWAIVGRAHERDPAQDSTAAQ